MASCSSPLYGKMPDIDHNGALVVPNVSAPDLAAAGAKGKVGLQLSTNSTAAEIRFNIIVISRLP